MARMTIGEFARASRLSPKALRLYDDLGLLPPAWVDPVNGYRYYDPVQLERARLVAWLRRLGMPLARIKLVCALEPSTAAEEVSAYWAQVETDTSARRELAAFLVDHLFGKDIAMPAKLEIRYATMSDTGLARPDNQDAAYAGARVLAVADGFGRDGTTASTAAVEVLSRLDNSAMALESEASPGNLLNVLETAVEQVNDDVRALAMAGTEPTESGTTLTALLSSGSRLALVHIGDSRAYLVRDNELFRITHDHTLLQSMLDEGRINADEARSHPARTMLLRSLSGRGELPPDLKLHDIRAGDRYLLCTDGLTAVAPDTDIGQVLAAATSPQETVRNLIALANHAGGPDNTTCVVADIVEQHH